MGLNILEKITDDISNKNINIADINDIISFFKLFSDKCHHGKEENIYFPALEKNGIQNENGPIGQMLIEHKEGRLFLENISNSIKDDAIIDKEFVDNSIKYIRLLRSHISKENTVLFPMGNKSIPADEQSTLLKQFEEYEKNVMGEGVHDKLHKMLNELDEKYLKK